MMVENPAQLGNGESGGIKIGLEVFAELDHLSRGQAARHDEQKRVKSAREGRRGEKRGGLDVVEEEVATRPLPTRHPRDKQTRTVRHVSHVLEALGARAASA